MHIALGHNRVSRLQKMSRFQGVHIKVLVFNSVYIIHVHGSCAEGLHFSALVILFAHPQSKE